MTRSIWPPLGMGLFFMVWARPLTSVKEDLNATALG
uniref:Uncharacterized protein n=1 Tax=Anguilla anguilla TaxID=7936 RepID=A0A0E9XU82_ANGAN